VAASKATPQPVAPPPVAHRIANLNKPVFSDHNLGIPNTKISQQRIDPRHEKKGVIASKSMKGGGRLFFTGGNGGSRA
jgi:hypothetical protein